MTSWDIEEKALIDSLIKRFKDILKLDLFKPKIADLIKTEYNKGIADLDTDLDLGVNLIPQDKDLDFLQDYVESNLDKASDDIADNIRQEIQRGIMNEETTKELQRRIKDLFKGKKYQTRLKMILRTELQRANNQGTLTGAKQAEATGLKLKKWLDVLEDERTSGICTSAYKRYGDREKAIPLDEPFIIKHENKTIKEQSPPFHPNCRTVLRITK